jgi:NitT/TauT family transport system substrate-binding protein
MRRAHGPAPVRSGLGLRTRGLLAAAAGLPLVLAACGGGASAGGTVSSTVTIAAMPGIDTAPLYLAQRDGMFAAAGLTHVVIHSYASEAADLAAIANGQADIAASDYGDIFFAQAQNPDLRILADGYDAAAGVLEVITMPTSTITSPGQLANPSVSVGVPGEQQLNGLAGVGPESLDAAAATQVLTNYLGNNAESVKWVAMSQQQELTELQSGQLAAALVSQPYIYEAESQFGAREILDACSGSTADLPLTGYVATKAWVRDNPAAVADFRAAIASAQTQAAMTGQVQQVLPKTTGMTVTDADLSTIGSYPAATSAINLERVVRLMTNFNMIKSGQAPAVPPMIVGRGS